MKLFSRPAPAADTIRFEGDFKSFGDALEAAGREHGYESKAATDRYVRRYQEINRDLAATAAASAQQLIPFMAAFSMAEPIDGIYEVFDFGGGYGAIYDQLHHLYPARKIRWTVVELPALVARASEMGASEWKRFETDIPARRFSLGIVSGTLQYLPDPEATWEALRRVQTPYLMVGRVPIAPHLTRDRLTVQHVPASMFAASLPVWFFSPAWVRRFEDFGRIVMQWGSPGDVTTLDGTRLAFQALLLARL